MTQQKYQNESKKYKNDVKNTNVLKTAKTAKMTPETTKMIKNCQNGTQISQNDSNLYKMTPKLPK